jgi:hypothetical protein
MKSFENDVRLFVYRHFVSEGKAPTSLEVANGLDIAPQKARQAFVSLAEQHVLVLEPGTGEIRMAMPFSAVPTAYRVIVGESAWWTN